MRKTNVDAFADMVVKGEIIAGPERGVWRLGTPFTAVIVAARTAVATDEIPVVAFGAAGDWLAGYQVGEEVICSGTMHVSRVRSGGTGNMRTVLSRVNAVLCADAVEQAVKIEAPQ